jgi:hypothetical protein
MGNLCAVRSSNFHVLICKNFLTILKNISYSTLFGTSIHRSCHFFGLEVKLDFVGMYRSSGFVYNSKAGPRESQTGGMVGCQSRERDAVTRSGICVVCDSNTSGAIAE